MRGKVKTGTLVNCTECKKDFTMRNGDLRQKRVEDDKYEVSYQCPHCGHKYLVCILNKELVKLQRQIADLRRYGNTPKTMLKEYKQKLEALNHR